MSCRSSSPGNRPLVNIRWLCPIDDSQGSLPNFNNYKVLGQRRANRLDVVHQKGFLLNWSWFGRIAVLVRYCVMAGLKPLIVCFGFILTWVSPVLGYVDPTLAPPVVRDQLGNVADENDVITWSSSYPKGKSYLSADEVNRDDINSKYYAIVDSFTNVVQPQDPPYGMVYNQCSALM